MDTNAITTLQDIETAAKFLAPVFSLQPAQAVALMLIGQAEGIHPVQALQLYDIIEGKPAPKATTVLSRFQARGGKVRWIEYSEARAAAYFSHPQHHPEEVLVELSLENAQQRRLHMGRQGEKFNWKYHGAAMLRARVSVAGVRMVDPAAINGQHIADELEDADLKSAEVVGVRSDGDAAPRHERIRELAAEGEKRAAEKAAEASAPPPVAAAAAAPAKEPSSAELRETQQRAKENMQLIDQAQKERKAPPLFTPEEEKRIAAKKAAEAAAKAAPSTLRLQPGEEPTVQHILAAAKDLVAAAGPAGAANATIFLTKLTERYDCGIKSTPGKPDKRVLTLCPKENVRALLADIEEDLRIMDADRKAAAEKAGAA